jgi:hypothetical protein
LCRPLARSKPPAERVSEVIEGFDPMVGMREVF